MTAHECGTSWFLAQLKPNCARIADKHLTRQGFRTFLPLEEETRQRKGKFVTADRPLFPGYIFVAFDVARGFWRTVNSTHGITAGKLWQRADSGTAEPGLSANVAL